MSQVHLIHRLNAYLKAEKREVKLSTRYCHGLTLLWLYCMMEQKDKLFLNNIQTILNCHYTSDFKKHANNFEWLLSKIEWLQNSKKYCDDVNQLDIHLLLEKDKKRGIAHFFTKKELNDTLQLVLTKDKMAAISIANHTIGVFKRDGIYFLYNVDEAVNEVKTFNALSDLNKAILKAMHLQKQYVYPLQINCVTTLVNDKSNAFIDHALENIKDIDASINGVTRLSLACENGDFYMVSKLLAKGADPNIPNQQSWSPLMIASEKGYRDIAKLLLWYGALVDYKNEDGLDAFFCANANHFTDIAISLKKCRGENTL